MELVCDDIYEQQYWTAIFDQMHEDPQVIDTWDMQWMYACWSQGGLVIAPNGNLISNLGFNRVDAAHTHGDSPRAKLATTSISEIGHPSFMVRDREADQTTFDYIFDGKTMKRTKLEKLSAKIRQRLGSAKRKVTTWL